eukprot:TRINITY_DN1858_c2_g1_i1.p3 TRINITY_DN1858_c2_g1~~TRINITY_DN1858_c2_g1_i1.p3  ORF type:complete len:105 (-),score=19.91 TRINITY_DN1858_c2_g1_i1:73-387(-)
MRQKLAESQRGFVLERQFLPLIHNVHGPVGINQSQKQVKDTREKMKRPKGMPLGAELEDPEFEDAVPSPVHRARRPRDRLGSTLAGASMPDLRGSTGTAFRPAQ